jgi:prevent-host-death family protein
MNTTATYTASEARRNLYSLIKKASKGLGSYEINLRGSDPVILMSKEELEGWIETMDIMSNPEEVKAIRQARKEVAKGQTISHKQLLKELSLEDEA